MPRDGHASAVWPCHLPHPPSGNSSSTTALEDLKAQLLYAHPQVVDAGRGLIWTDATVSVPADAPVSTHVSPRPPLTHTPRPSDENLMAPIALSTMPLRLYEDLVSALLQREGRVSYRSLRQLFGFDEACLYHVRQELIFKQLARDVHGEGLESTGGLRVVVTDGQPTEPTDATVEIASAPSDAVPVLPAALSDLPLRRSGDNSRCCSVTWWAPPSSPASSTPKTGAPWCAPTRKLRPRSSSTTRAISRNTSAMACWSILAIIHSP